MESQALKIHDNDRSTAGGPPGWLAFGVVTTSYFVTLLGVVAYCLALP